METAGGIHKKDICLSRLGCLHCVIYDRRGIRAFCGTDDIDAGSLRPLSKLLICCRAESVSACDQHFFALFAVISRKFSYRSSLADAVYADHKDHRRSLFEGVGVLALFHFISDPQDQLLAAVRAVPDPLILYLLPEIVQKFFRRLNADISHDHRLFQFFEKFLADLLVPVGIENDVHVVGDIRLSLAKPLFKPVK